MDVILVDLEFVPLEFSLSVLALFHEFESNNHPSMEQMRKNITEELLHIGAKKDDSRSVRWMLNCQAWKEIFPSSISLNTDKSE